jgi:endogenous inhibitor of DNA gyrase (YacG/DUF329 family)
MRNEMQLKPCPFCGRKARSSKSYANYYPRCDTENCIGNQGWTGFETEERAIKAWNRRVLSKHIKRDRKRKRMEIERPRERKRLIRLDLSDFRAENI